MSIAGNPLKEGLLRDVMQVTYRDSVEEIDSFELVVNNWDADSRQPQPKYEPSVASPQHEGIFDPGTETGAAHGLHGGDDVDADRRHHNSGA